MNEIQLHLSSEKERLLRLRNNCVSKHSPYNQQLHLDTTRGKTYYRLSNNKYLGTIHNPIVQQLLTDGIIDSLLKEIDLRLETINHAYPLLKPIDIREIDEQLKPVYRSYQRSILADLGLVDTKTLPVSVESCNPDYYPENLQYVTSSGIVVRSKSELMIAEAYISMGIPFIYEPRIDLPDGRTIYADFKVFARSKDRWMYHEHAGMMTDPLYRKRFHKKIEDYISVNLFPHFDILFTFDNPDGSINMHEIRTLIELFMK